jgi:V-type H+-transporting ATPase proteolipid subunit
MANPHLLTGLGASLAMFLSAAGSSAASVPAGLFAQHAMGAWAWAPVIITGVLAIYGCIIAVIVSHNLMNDDMTEAQGYRNLSAGLAVGLTCLASGLGMHHYIHAYMHHHRQHPPPPRGQEAELREGLISTTTRELLVPTWGFLAVLVFIEAIGLYGLIVGLLMSSHQP